MPQEKRLVLLCSRFRLININITNLPSLDSLSSLLSDVKIDLALLVVLVFFDTELILDGTGEGVLLTDAGLDVDWPDGVGMPVVDVPSLGAAGTVPVLPF